MPHGYHGASGLFGSGLVNGIFVFAASGYLCGWVCLRSDPSNRIPAWRASSFLLGLTLIWVAVASPISALDHESLTVHMLKHLVLMTLAPPLIWMSKPAKTFSQVLSRQLVDRLIPSASQARPRKIARVLAKPEFCWVAATAVLIGWHIPAVFTLALQSPAWHLFEQTTFLASGLLFWLPVIQPSPGTWDSDISVILYLFFATLPCDILAGFLVFCDRAIYPIYLPSTHLFGFSPLVDQQYAAALMWTSVTLVYFAAAGILTMRLLSPPNSRLAPGTVEQELEAF